MGFIQQAAALCLLKNHGLVLVSNKSGKRWVLPKGHMEPEDSDHTDRAKAEAWEEAGIEVLGQGTSLGHYLYRKKGGVYIVHVVLFREAKIRDQWPECKLRERRLVSLAEAQVMLDEPGLKDMIAGLRRAEGV